MKTSKIKIRPFIPLVEKKREPFAVLKYKNVEIELDYTIMNYLYFDNKSEFMHKTGCIAAASFREILHEMNTDILGYLPEGHRDKEFFDSVTHNHLHPINNEIEWEQFPEVK